ncbi:hypothetical protein EB796_018243 [Bugula neritina]|uniref:Uncharacterized protein n=1 Tax=Bugula neritina TaxID=10212 RepID=A0A7J7JB22_BUGNE|nr:hypothetical protein EB796_018243 [Bugula neritina]
MMNCSYTVYTLFTTHLQNNQTLLVSSMKHTDDYKGESYQISLIQTFIICNKNYIFAYFWCLFSMTNGKSRRASGKSNFSDINS